MRSESEIKEAIELCQSCNPTDMIGIQNRDCTVEALRYALGIDDADTSPMLSTLKDLLQTMKDDPESHHIKTDSTSLSE